MNSPAPRRLFRAGYTTSLHPWLHLRSIFPTQKPPSPIPRIPPKVAPKRATKTPAPRINSRIFFLVKAKGNNKGRFAHHLKVANRSFSVAETSPARCAASAARAETLHRQVQGRSPWRAFGDFPRDGKVTRGGGAERPLMGVWGPPAPTSGSRSQVWRLAPRGGAAPRVGPFGVEGRSARSWGCGGLQPPLRGAGAKSGDLLPRGRSPSQEPLGEKGAQAPFSKTAAAPAAPAGRPPPPGQSG